MTHEINAARLRDAFVARKADSLAVQVSLESLSSSCLLLKNDRASKQITVVESTPADDEAFSRIRCPLCGWQPTASSRWRCHRGGTPEPFFKGCGTIWNTFSTRGRCPGCAHQWRWTSCLRCHEASLHEDWYEEKDSR